MTRQIQVLIQPMLTGWVLFGGTLLSCAPPPSSNHAPPVATATVPSSSPTLTQAPSVASPSATAIQTDPSSQAAPRRLGAGPCRLPQPVKSNDACQSDADCGPSSPCHAKACVAKARSQPPSPGTICSMNMVCDSVDVNRCGCHEGFCALIPP